MRLAWHDLLVLTEPMLVASDCFFFKCTQAICLIISSRILPKKNLNASAVERFPDKDQESQVLAHALFPTS